MLVGRGANILPEIARRSGTTSRWLPRPTPRRQEGEFYLPKVKTASTPNSTLETADTISRKLARLTRPKFRVALPRQLRAALPQTGLGPCRTGQFSSLQTWVFHQ